MKRIIISIFLSFWILSGVAQDLKVRVLAPDNTPLFRATVSINGTAVGLTDSLGMIAISARRVALGDTVSASYAGMQSGYAIYNRDSELRIILHYAVIDEIVVAGKRTDLSFATISARAKKPSNMQEH